ncbi:transposable element Tc1 transposase [Trichonephila clavipes]|uniref:Transposable element Tc1 transposase n=1 Tax=Trichonephila clavipes TaxID=2585209 RepID=A0A8X6S7X8_TRICX|nr:transposable element Tc1 transposase [Trichonephila clavipes]
MSTLFTDVFQFSLISDSRNTLIKREPGTATNARKIDHYDKGGLMICTGITLVCRTYTNVFERDIWTDARYRNEIWESHVRLFRGAVGLNVPFSG